MLSSVGEEQAVSNNDASSAPVMQMTTSPEKLPSIRKLGLRDQSTQLGVKLSSSKTGTAAVSSAVYAQSEVTPAESPLPSPGLSAPQSAWQKPYSDLSRFPSASHRTRGAVPSNNAFSVGMSKWPTAGESKFITPLPSPYANRSRTLSDAASETSSIGNASLTSSVIDHGDPKSQGPNRSRTNDFFFALDAALSPPPPPRMKPDVNNRDRPLRTAPLHGSPDSLPSISTIVAPASAPPSARPDMAAFEALPSATLSFPDSEDGDVSLDNHRRTASAGTAVSTPTLNTSFARDTAVDNSPAQSPTDSLYSRVMREPPLRLPSLPATSHAEESQTTASRTSSLRRSIKASLNEEPASFDPSLGQTQTSATSETDAGTILADRYEVLHTIGLGAFSKVVLASHLSDDSSVAPANGLRETLADNPKHGEVVAARDTVAVKMISRAHIKKNDRMRISIVREIEVLKVRLSM